MEKLLANQEFMGAMTALLFALISLLSAVVTRLINAKFKSENMKTELLKLDDRVFTVVKKTAQTTVDNLKDAAKDGEFTADEAARVKHEALEEILASLGPAKTVAKNIGLPDEGALVPHVSAKIEAAVHDLARADGTKPEVAKEVAQ